MPEGHTIHRLARDHRRWFTGHEVAVSSPQGRFADGAALVDGLTFETAEAWGKHLFHRFDGARFVHVHLGLFGKMPHHRSPAPAPRGTVRMRVVGNGHTVDLTGPNVCEVIGPGERDAIVDRLGPDVIRQDAEPQRAWDALQRRSVPIARALLDQSVLAGVGNVYRAEVLFVHGIDPQLPAQELDRSRFEAIWTTLRDWMRAAVDEHRIVTVAPDEADGARRTYVYRQDDCLRCGDTVRRFDLSGRWAYACPTCQTA